MKNLDNDIAVDMQDTCSVFSLATAGEHHASKREASLRVLSHAWDGYSSRQHVSEDVWLGNLTAHITNLLNLRIAHVREWISSNIARFQGGQASISELTRTFENATVDLKGNVQQVVNYSVFRADYTTGSMTAKVLMFVFILVTSALHAEKQKLARCRKGFYCVIYWPVTNTDGLQGRSSGKTHVRHFIDDGFNLGSHSAVSRCVVTAHLCGQPCQLFGRQGCLQECTRVRQNLYVTVNASELICSGRRSCRRRPYVCCYRPFLWSGTSFS
jgi:hypothetical protein